MIDLRFRPYQSWPHKPTIGRKNGTFRVTYTRTLDDLESELSHLGAKNITVSTGHRMEDIRNDGWPRSNARAPFHPGVLVYCETKHGPLSFACDTYTDWKDNLRGISLTLENLRAVERYGAVKGGQQYRGFAQIPAAPAGTGTSTADVYARQLLAAGDYEVSDTNIALIRRDAEQLRAVYGKAVLKTHPDHGGTAESNILVRQAYDALKKGLG